MPREGLRAALGAKTAADAARLPGAWPRDAAYRKAKPVVAVERRVRRRKADAVAAVGLGIGNGRAGETDDKTEVTVGTGYGFRNTDSLVALLTRRRSDCRSQPPGRTEDPLRGRQPK